MSLFKSTKKERRDKAEKTEVNFSIIIRVGHYSEKNDFSKIYFLIIVIFLDNKYKTGDYRLLTNIYNFIYMDIYCVYVYPYLYIYIVYIYILYVYI